MTIYIYCFKWLVVLSFLFSSEVVGRIHSIDSTNLHSFLSSEAPGYSKQNTNKVINFYAHWCQYCISFRSTSLEKIMRILEEEGTIVGESDVGTNQALASRFGISQIPTLYFVHASKGVYRYEGRH